MNTRLPTRRRFLLNVAAAPMAAATLSRFSFAVGPDANSWSSVVDRAIAYLRSAQASDGSFSKDRSLGVTGIVVTGVLETGRVPVEDPFIVRALRFIESLVEPKEGHIAGKNPKNQLKNYVTSVNMRALATADKVLLAAKKKPRYSQILKNGGGYLTALQWDEAEDKPPQDAFYGGFGYDSKNRPDLSNTQFALDALKDLKDLGISKNDPAFRRAMVFVSRCQNLKGEYNDQPWAAKINDGSFVYSAAGGGETKADVRADGGLVGYGSMTYAGIKSMIYAGVDRNDPRVKAGLDWIRKHYTVDENPGMPKARNQQGLYYYYHTMAKCLDALGFDLFEDADGVKHDWRKDLTDALAKRQHPEGYWINERDHWMEGDANLVTGYALMTLGYCKPKK